MSTQHGEIRTAETEELHVSYEVRGPEDGPPLLLLHGWPYDVRAWDTVAATLAAAGYRTIAPYLRGFGETRFRDASTPRIAQPVVMANDAVQFLDCLGIERLPVIGHDWGGRIGYALAALWSQRVERLVALSVGYETAIKPGDRVDYHQQQAQWYQWFFASERGREALENNRRNLCRNLWRMWSPTWSFTEEQFARTADSWLNPDWVEITLHSYRVRWGNAPPDTRYSALEGRLKQHPAITVPTILLHGGADACSLPESTREQAPSFVAGYERRVLPGIGHAVPIECPEAVSGLFAAL